MIHPWTTLKVNQQRATFRLKPQVVQMLAISCLALAIPLTVLILGVKGFSAKLAASTPEAPGLRAALEQVASKNLAPPARLDSECRRFVLRQGTPSERQRAIVKSAAELGGTVVPIAQQDGGERLIVHIPAASAARFEEVALAGFSSAGEPSPAGDACLYEIVFPPP